MSYHKEYWKDDRNWGTDMNNFEIEYTLGEYGVMVTCAYESHALVKKKPRWYVVNTNRCGNSGLHWTAFYFPRHGPAEFFGSFGNPPEYYHRRFVDVLTVNASKYWTLVLYIFCTLAFSRENHEGHLSRFSEKSLYSNEVFFFSLSIDVNKILNKPMCCCFSDEVRPGLQLVFDKLTIDRSKCACVCTRRHL